MRGLLKWTLVLALALGMTGIARAQRQGGRGFGGAGFLLQNEGVQKELNITDEQKTKLKDAVEKVREDNKDLIAKGRDMTREDREKLAKATTEAIGKVLDDKQVKRFQQIQIQTRGAAAFQNPEVQSKLKLTDDQKDKIKKIGDESREKMRALFQGGGDREENAKKFAEMRKETLEKTTGVLTDDQKKTWKEMTGKPFEVRLGRRPRT